MLNDAQLFKSSDSTAGNGITTADPMLVVLLAGGVVLVAAFIICCCQACRNGPKNASAILLASAAGDVNEQTQALLEQEQAAPGQA